MARATLFDSISDGMLALDLSGRILDVNPAMRQILANRPVT